MAALPDAVALRSPSSLPRRQRLVVTGAVRRPDGLVFFRTDDTPVRTYRVQIPLTIATAFIVCSIIFNDHARHPDERGLTIAAGLAMTAVVGVRLYLSIREWANIRRGTWPHGLTLWPERLVSYHPRGSIVTAPWSAVRSLTTTPDGTIVLEATAASGDATQISLGPFRGDPTEIDASLQAWVADPAAHPVATR